jgi:hypothetical protein
VHVPDDAPPETWHSIVFGGDPEHVAFVPAGTYANTGDLHIAVSRTGARA